MMKMKQIYLFLSLALLCACSSDEELPAVAQQPCPALELTVSAGGFITDSSASGTRATDNGAATTFENGDRAGVIVLEDGTLKGNNLPYKYNGGSWSFDAATVNSEGTGKSVYYYDNKATNVTYIVYFPYSTDANDVTSIEGDGGLKSKFIPKADQQSEADYRASDLMIWQSTAGIAPQKTLAATLTHAYNSVSLLPEVHYTLDNSDDFVHPSPAISDVNFLMDDEIVYPYKAADGSYRCILRSGLTNSSVRCFYTVDNKTYNKDLTVSLAGANTRYSSTQRVNAGSYSLANAQVGDFYCKNSSNEGYLIPGGIASLTENQQKDCLGIVYWLGDIKSDNYGLLDTRFPNGTHGLVVSLWEMPDPDNAGGEPKMTWTYGGYEYVNDWLSSATWSGSPSRPGGFSSIQITDRMQGYANTVALEEYNKYIENPDNNKNQNLRVKPIKGLAAFQTAHPAPVSSSGWYWPSVCELKQVCWGQGVTSQSTSGKSMLNPQIGKVGGTTFGNDSYWSSTEFSNYSYNAWCVLFRDGYVYSNGRKDYRAYRVRPLLAF